MPELSATQEKFILHWGEMGAKWGINRTVAQIHALLLISEKPLAADEIATTLSIARSNVSTSIKELQGWGIVKGAHVLGDRREHFETMKDVWEVARTVIKERKRREIDPTSETLRECIKELEAQGESNSYTAERLRQLMEILEAVDLAFAHMKDLPKELLLQLTKIDNLFQGLKRAPAKD